jgi:hypothetical protein
MDERGHELPVAMIPGLARETSWMEWRGRTRRRRRQQRDGFQTLQRSQRRGDAPDSEQVYTELV